MVDATPRSGGVVGDCSAGSAELVVEGNAGCEREQAYGDADEQVVWCAGAVPLEGEQVFAGPEDGLDPLPDRRQVRPALRFAASRWADDRRAKAGDGVGEVAAGVAFVADDRSPPRSACGSSLSATSRSGRSAATRAAARGVPSLAQARCRRLPQNQREWLFE